MIVITGAAGFVGREVVKQARAAGSAVRAIVRDPKSKAARALAEMDGVELIHGNVIHAPSLVGAMDGAKSVMHLVGIIHEWREQTFQRIHTEATSNVLEEAKRAGVKRFLHMSALGTRADARSRYHQTKWAAEEAVRNSGLAWTIFRPSVIYGPGDKSITMLSNVVRRAPFVPVLGDGNSKIQPVAVEIVAKCFVAALKNDSTVGRVYDVCGPEVFTWNELYDRLLAFYGLRKSKVHLPLPLARMLASVAEKALPNPPFNRDQVIMAQENNVGDPKPAERDFILKQETFERGIARYLKRGD